MSAANHHDDLAPSGPLTIQGAADYLSCSVSTVRRLTDDGSIRACPVGLGQVRQHKRYLVEDLEAYLASVGRGGSPLYVEAAKTRGAPIYRSLRDATEDDTPARRA